MSGTPKTEKERGYYHSAEGWIFDSDSAYVRGEFAEKLETELTQANERVEAKQKAYENCANQLTALQSAHEECERIIASTVFTENEGSLIGKVQSICDLAVDRNKQLAAVTKESDELKSRLAQASTDFRMMESAYEGLRISRDRAEKEMDELKVHFEDIKEHGTEEINAAVELRDKLAQALVERDEAIKLRDEWCSEYTIARNQRDQFLEEHNKVAAERDKLLGFYNEIVKELGHDCVLSDLREWKACAEKLGKYAAHFGYVPSGTTTAAHYKECEEALAELERLKGEKA